MSARSVEVVLEDCHYASSPELHSNLREVVQTQVSPLTVYEDGSVWGPDFYIRRDLTAPEDVFRVVIGKQMELRTAYGVYRPLTEFEAGLYADFYQRLAEKKYQDTVELEARLTNEPQVQSNVIEMSFE